MEESGALEQAKRRVPVLSALACAQEAVWANPSLRPFDEASPQIERDFGISMDDIEDAAARLDRFAPFLAEVFPETAPKGGVIESPLTEIPAMLSCLRETYASNLAGALYLKRDSDLAVAGSVKARGGIYEVLCHAEKLALDAGILNGEDDDYRKLSGGDARRLFSAHSVQVGSTGNLGLSIGISSATLGFRAVVHMSADAKQWKKDLLRAKGAEVVEYVGDYGAAVASGRALAQADPMSYFVDDENSRELFMGYAVSALRLKAQLGDAGVLVDAEHPLFVYIPCGVGGAPGGVTFGLKQVFGDDVHCFFVEPTQAPCMLAGMASGLHNAVCVQDLGLTGVTEADGLAVGRPSGFVGRVMEPLLSGEFTVADERLVPFLRDLWRTEGLFIEPSSCAAFMGPAMLMKSDETLGYIATHGLADVMQNACHIVWATGGSLVPAEIRNVLLG